MEGRLGGVQDPRALPLLGLGRRGAWAPLLLLALVAAFFWKIVFLGRAIGGLDVLEYFYAYRAYAQQAVDAGRLPLWNPDHFGGAPFLANIQTALFYPPTALFYVLDFPAAYTWSVVLHSFLGGLFAYLFARQSLHTERVPALLGSMAFTFGGFLGGQMGHLNQLSSAIWLPLLLLCWDKAVSRRQLAYVLLGALAVALQFLAGHSQESFYMLVTLGLYAVYQTLADVRRSGWPALPLNALSFALTLGLGVGLAAIQLVPTSELTAWSIRANGLSYDEATTFSLKGTMILNALLPPFGNRDLLLQPGGSEFLGYVGLTALVLALAGVCYGRRRHVVFFAVLGALALFFAIGQQNPLYPVLFRLAPGFNLFRVPARWLYVYGFSAAMLASLGADAVLAKTRQVGWRPLAAVCVLFAALGAAFARMESLPAISTRLGWLVAGAAAAGLVFAAILWPRGRSGLSVTLVALTAVELWTASQSLDYNHPTAAQVFEQPIGTIDFLHRQSIGYRSLSVARDEFVPSVEGQARAQLGPSLGEDGLLAYLTYYKLREIMEPNTSLAVNLPTIDGYDGGLLPLGRYVRFKDVLTDKKSAPDDRIRFVLKWLPNRALLNLAGVRYVLMDGLSDRTVDGVTYDLSSFIRLSGQQPEAVLTLSQPVAASALGLVAATSAAAEGVVATVTVADGSGVTKVLAVNAGGAPVGQLPTDDKLPTRQQLLPLGTDLPVQRVELRLAPGAPDVYINGLALIDERNHTAYSPLAAPGAEMRRIYEGDVKIYDNTTAEPPAFLVHEGQLASDLDQAAAALSSGTFDPARQAIVEADPQPPPSGSLLGRVVGKLRRSLPGQAAPFSMPESWLEPASVPAGAPPDRVSFEDFRPERIVIRSDSLAPGFLVVTQAFYPGWKALVDGAPTRLVAADGLFQAVHLPAGSHQVELTFEPRSLLIGEIVTGVSLGVLLLGFALVVLGWRRSR